MYYAEKPMPCVKFYDTEREVFPEFAIEVLSQKYALQIVSKLVRHYKLKKLEVKLSNRHISPTYEQIAINPKDYQNYIVFQTKTPITLGEIIHEVAHHVEACNGKNSRHTKKLLAIMRRIFKYCKRHDFWNMTKPLIDRRHRVRVRVD